MAEQAEVGARFAALNTPRIGSDHNRDNAPGHKAPDQRPPANKNRPHQRRGRGEGIPHLLRSRFVAPPRDGLHRAGPAEPPTAWSYAQLAGPPQSRRSLPPERRQSSRSRRQVANQPG